jgi:hypothetical protein
VSTRDLPGVGDGAAVAVGRAVALAVADGIADGVTFGTSVSVEAAVEDVSGNGANEGDDELQPATKTTVLSRTMTVRRFLPRIAYLSWDLWTSWFRPLNGLLLRSPHVDGSAGARPGEAETPRPDRCYGRCCSTQLRPIATTLDRRHGMAA